GRREVAGLVIGVSTESAIAPEKIRSTLAVRSQLPPLSPAWRALGRFAADYYQRPLGEVVLPALPKNLRALKPVSLNRSLKTLAKQDLVVNPSPAHSPALMPAQQAAVDTFAASRAFMPCLLHGVTGSGKTEVYLQPAAQLLVL